MEYPTNEMLEAIELISDIDLSYYNIEKFREDFDENFVFPGDSRISLSYHILQQININDPHVSAISYYQWSYEESSIVKKYKEAGFDPYAFINNSNYLVKPELDSIPVLLKFLSFLKFTQNQLSDKESVLLKRKISTMLNEVSLDFLLPSFKKIQLLIGEKNVYHSFVRLCEQIILTDLKYDSGDYCDD